MLFSYLAHRRACKTKQQQREETIQSLPAIYHVPVTPSDTTILNQSVVETVTSVQLGKTSPRDILIAFGKKALKAHEATNCLTEIMIGKAEIWADECDKQGPLAGMPVSLKDMVSVEGFDACIGYSSLVNKPSISNSSIVRLLRDAGAVPFVKTTIPTTLFSFESSSDVFGTSENPHKKGYAPGGSSGGEAALLAFGGSRIGIGTDVAGSVRIPSHYSGCYTIKASQRRIPAVGSATSNSGQEGILAVHSPMARTLGDLEYFWKAIVTMKPWTYDHACIALPWREVDLSKKRVKWGVIYDDGIVTPSPACARALREVVSTLEKHGHEVVALNPPSPYQGFKIACQLIGDACTVAVSKVVSGESNDPGMAQAVAMFRLPLWMKRLYALYLRYIRRDEIYAGLVETWHKKTAPQIYELVTQREAYRAQWFDVWKDQELDFVLTVPNACPAVPHKGMKHAFTNCSYTFLWNMLDYPAGVMPITHVDSTQDALAASFKPKNTVEAGAYKLYDAKRMDGLPVGVQVIGPRLEEEKVMEGMKVIEDLLKQDGKAYQLLRT